MKYDKKTDDFIPEKDGTPGNSKNGGKGGKFKGKYPDFDKVRSNDIAWWNRNSIMFENYTKIPFYYNRGDVYNAKASDVVNPAQLSEFTIPAFMIYDFVPTIGRASSVNDFVNLYINDLYKKVQSKTSGTEQQFQAGDMGMCLFCLSSLATMFAMCKRALGTYARYSQTNYYWPRAICQGLGLDPALFEESVSAIPTMTTRLNVLIQNFNALSTPAFITSFARHYSLSHNIYAESQGDQTELYAYRPYCIYKWDDVNSEAKTEIVPYGDGVTVDTWLDMIEECILAYRNSDIFATINSYLLRAFPEAAFVQIDLYKGEETKMWVDPILNLQTRNMIIYNVGTDVLLESFNIKVNAIKNALVCEPRSPGITNAIDDTPGLRCAGQIINLPPEWVDSEGIMEATRLMPCIDLVPENDDTIRHWIYYPGTEMVVKGQILTPKVSTVAGQFKYDIGNLEFIEFKQFQDINQGIQGPRAFLAKFQFKYRPTTYYYTWAPTTYDYTVNFYGTDANLESFRNMRMDALKELHNTAHASVWYLGDMPEPRLPR